MLTIQFVLKIIIFVMKKKVFAAVSFVCLFVFNSHCFFDIFINKLYIKLMCNNVAFPVSFMFLGGIPTMSRVKSCSANCHSGSQNVGFLRGVIECCDTDRCNAQYAPGIALY